MDFCVATTGANDSDLTNTVGLDEATCPVKEQSSPRQVAGGPRAENIYKCQLKPLDFGDADYGSIRFSDDQKTRLRAVFLRGCLRLARAGRGTGSGDAVDVVCDRPRRAAAWTAADIDADSMSVVSGTRLSYRASGRRTRSFPVFSPR